MAVTINIQYDFTKNKAASGILANVYYSKKEYN